MRFGWMEVLLIGGVILLIFGPKRFGLIGKSAKRGFKEFKDEATDEDNDQKKE
ncbi:MAG: twin-arginine translocase TatA/TatE family subunit [Bacillota bacterium]|nr:twin-arginine translocase TatA/TatE family subunit [Bacillota bacterium]MDW7677210.1 twin-arginine translocase TatA/TatE family subunit [Bacillota bacterium]